MTVYIGHRVIDLSNIPVFSPDIGNIISKAEFISFLKSNSHKEAVSIEKYTTISHLWVCLHYLNYDIIIICEFSRQLILQNRLYNSSLD